MNNVIGLTLAVFDAFLNRFIILRKRSPAALRVRNTFRSTLPAHPRCRRSMWLLVTLLPLTALGAQQGDFVYQTSGGGAVVTAYVGPGGAVVIPDILGGLPVKQIGMIGEPCFRYLTNVTSVTIPNSVTKIENGNDERLAGTDPTQSASRLELELAPRLADLVASDKTPVSAGQRAVYFRSVPGRYYCVQSAADLSGAWTLQAVRITSTSQTRFVLPVGGSQIFYRVVALP